MKEEWKDIEGYECVYQVSNFGRVRSLDHYVEGRHPRNPNFPFINFIPGKIKKLRPHKAGYWLVDLWKGKKQQTCTVHRLVAKAFIPNPHNLPEVNHIDEDKSNSIVTNLEWVTRTGNMRHGTCGERMGRGHWVSVIQMTPDGKFIKKWQCTQHAADALGLSMTHIIEVCRGKAKTYGGFKWKYTDNNHKKLI